MVRALRLITEKGLQTKNDLRKAMGNNLNYFLKHHLGKTSRVRDVLAIAEEYKKCKNWMIKSE